MIELVMKGTYKGRTFWITKHEIEELPELNLIPHEWYCGYVEYEPTVKHDSEDFDVFGGITFVGNLSQLDGFNSSVAVIGFDTAHINGEKMTANDVREECFNLIGQIESLKERRYCNRCGAQVKPDFNFCEICGQKLEKASEENGIRF
ncbi:zinc-ribbon domain-containing protein [Ligilactobacillus aviarius]|uniref:zinc-ribbon domain-containing protein n=1 Tax=Ligilactobacillus aviarius TaxID=1606 RepID=UPI0024BA0D73|nr:zinc-ribbon domain-containing protein [Ligilactobacillus aviarius]